MANNFEQFAANHKKNNPNARDWEVKDKWLDSQHSEEDEQISSGMQTVSPLQPTVNYREESEEAPQPQDPQTAALNQHIQQMAAKNPNLGLKLDCVGKKDGATDSRVWYVFSKQTEQTPTGPQAKRFGGYGTHELQNMQADIQKMGEQGINNYFNTKNPNQPKR